MPLFRRFIQYTGAGGSTFLLDLALVYGLITYLHFSEAVAVALGFLIAITVNFFISYHWVFRGTKRARSTGYLFFVGLAMIGLSVVVSGTLFLYQTFDLSLYLARILVAGVVGTANFLLNNFFNFRMVD